MKNQVSRLLHVLGMFAVIILFTQVQSIHGQQKEVRVAAAADLKFAMGELAAEFKKATGTEVSATFGTHLHCSLPPLQDVECGVLIEQFRAC